MPDSPSLPDRSWQDPSTDIENVNAAYVIERDRAREMEAEVDRLRAVIRAARDHAMDKGDRDLWNLLYVPGADEEVAP